MYTRYKVMIRNRRNTDWEEYSGIFDTHEFIKDKMAKIRSHKNPNHGIIDQCKKDLKKPDYTQEMVLRHIHDELLDSADRDLGLFGFFPKGHVDYRWKLIKRIKVGRG